MPCSWLSSRTRTFPNACSHGYNESAILFLHPPSFWRVRTQDMWISGVTHACDVWQGTCRCAGCLVWCTGAAGTSTRQRAARRARSGAGAWVSGGSWAPAHSSPPGPRPRYLLPPTLLNILHDDHESGMNVGLMLRYMDMDDAHSLWGPRRQGVAGTHQ
jgi:hypothetical protein